MADRIYNSAAWKAIRQQVLIRDRGRCQVRGPGCTLQAEAVDHIVPWRAGGSWYDPNNLRATCTHCNSGRANRARQGLPPDLPVGPSRDW